jgi:acetoin utilization protein AcuB
MRMKVRDIMKAPIITVEPQQTAIEVLRLGREHKIRHYPVVQEDRLVGIVSDRAVREATTSPMVYQRLLDLLATVDLIPIERIMETRVITAGPETSVVEAKKLLLEHKIGCLPVVKDGRLVGIVTDGDLL